MPTDPRTTPRFFSFSNAGGFDWHETLEAAKARAEADLDYERECAPDDGWDEGDTLSICYGQVVGACFVTERKPWADHLREQGAAEEDLTGNHRFDEYVDFDIKELPLSAPEATERREN